MWKNIIGQALYQLVVNLIVLYRPDILFDVEPHSVHHTTIIFNTFVMCQLFNEINSRKLNDELNVFRGLLNNSVFLGILLFTILVQYVFVVFGGDFTGTRPLTTEEWFITALLGFGGIPWRVLLTQITIKDQEVKQTPPKKPLISQTSGSGKKNWGKARNIFQAVNAIKKPLLIDKIRRRHSVIIPGFGSD